MRSFLRTIRDKYLKKSILNHLSSAEKLLLLGHMRCGSSLLTHILVDNPEIAGYGETHTRYNTSNDFEEWLYRSHYANVCDEHFDGVKMPETLDFSIIQAGLAY
jgi:hypothetical protein